MLTQGPPPDAKCKLNVSSFLTLPHLLCHFYQEFCRVGGRVVDSYQVLGGGIGGGYFLTVFCFLLLLLSSVLMSCLFFQ